MIIVTMRLGLNYIEEEYYDSVLDCFNIP